ncbi:MAG: hypothetical protein HN411_02595 [Waddliaceae bacterium]|nr:hypothetical protein [Waddliaceae bacterium]MBT3578698.1 hypothetical protein [Waddliaceae bacterium]MBT4444400.1 hypothetical protein [Waddliaceae bacterium]MBT6928315.1 hypothetical protein [Waddliaceae bacterium]MBT7265001.1 hypothetical protein [Waddliaceae bacterium]
MTVPLTKEASEHLNTFFVADGAFNTGDIAIKQHNKYKKIAQVGKIVAVASLAFAMLLPLNAAAYAAVAVGITAKIITVLCSYKATRIKNVIIDHIDQAFKARTENSFNEEEKNIFAHLRITLYCRVIVISDYT